MTSEKKRYNGIFDIALLKAFEANGSDGSEKLKLTFTVGNKNGVYLFNLYGEKALNEG
jgi:hypothetical protein